MHANRWLVVLLFASLANGQFEGLEANPPTRGERKRVEARLVADVSAIVPGKPLTLGVTFDVPKDHYFYYRTPGQAGSPTTVEWVLPGGFEIGPLEFPTPTIKYVPLDENDPQGKLLLWNYVYTKSTTLFAELTPPRSLEPGQTVTIRAKVKYQFCSKTTCVPVSKELALELPVVADAAEVTASDAAQEIAFARKGMPHSGKSRYVTVTPRLSQSKLRPGDQATLAVEVTVADGFKLQMNRPPMDAFISTDLILENPPGIKEFALPSYPPPLAPKKPEPGFESLKEYRGSFTITVPIVAEETLAGPSVTLRAVLRYQACSQDGSCFPPEGVAFALDVPVAAKGSAIEYSAVPVPAIEGDAENFDQFELEAVGVAFLPTWFQNLVFAFLGGLILNIMPCVLPVIAIKVLSFVDQAQGSRSRIFALNFSYVFGVMSVFLLLGILVAAGSLRWGSLFQNQDFNILIACLVFAMGLALLGVFEIPIPGFVGSVASSPSQQGGLFGAYLTGILATLLATPCTGPFLGTTIGWAIRQPSAMTILIFATMGFGMAFPYVLFAFNPAFVRWIPKPGDWMVRFKEFAGFVLMGTVIFIVQANSKEAMTALLVMLLGIALFFWMIGNLYDFMASFRKKWTVRIIALLLGGSVFAFGWTLRESDPKIEFAWQPFSDEKLTQLLKERKTVIVDFTADWCTNCKINEKLALKTTATREKLEELGAVALIADYTHYSPEITKWLDKFEVDGVPLTVIFPAKNPSRPILLHALFTQGTLLQKLEQAGPSLSNQPPAASPTTTASVSPSTKRGL